MKSSDFKIGQCIGMKHKDVLYAVARVGAIKMNAIHFADTAEDHNFITKMMYDKFNSMVIDGYANFMMSDSYNAHESEEITQEEYLEFTLKFS